MLALYKFKLPVRRFLHDMLEAGAQHFEVPKELRARSRSTVVTGMDKGAAESRHAVIWG